MAEARSAVSMGMEDIHNKQYEADLGNLWKETYTLWMRASKRRYYRIRYPIDGFQH